MNGIIVKYENNSEIREIVAFPIPLIVEKLKKERIENNDKKDEEKMDEDTSSLDVAIETKNAPQDLSKAREKTANINLKTNRFSCSFGSQTFARKSTAKIHERVHTNPKSLMDVFRTKLFFITIIFLSNKSFGVCG